MIGQELLLLGLLREKPRHGYEIKQRIREILQLFAGIQVKSIYYPLKIMEQRGLVAKKVKRSGRWPARFVYTLTPKGKARFEALLGESLFDFKRPQFSLDLSLYFLHYMAPEVARRKLRTRQLVLRRLSRQLAQMVKTLHNKESAALVRILEHNLKMVEAESTFLGGLTEILPA